MDFKGYWCFCLLGFFGDKCESKCKKIKNKISLKKKIFYWVWSDVGKFKSLI